MDIVTRLASSLDRRDERPNEELAQEIVLNKDSKTILELIHLLKDKKAIQNDSIKVLYEIGEIEPILISPFIDEFLDALKSKNNRLQWGAMMALSCITQVSPNDIYSNLGIILEVTDQGSVITRDQAVNILIQLGGINKYKSEMFSLLKEQLLGCPTNQLPMYAERTLVIINDENKMDFMETLNIRLPEIEKESKKKRILKILKKLSV
jgi:hypothetical protein